MALIKALGVAALGCAGGPLGAEAFAPRPMAGWGKVATRAAKGGLSVVAEPARARTMLASVATPADTSMKSDSSPAEEVAMPKGSTNDWEVHKFGGASLANPELYRTVGDLLITEAQGRGEGGIPTMSVVSAMGGMTDLLIKVVDSALSDFEQAKADLAAAVERQITTLQALAPPEITAPIEARIMQDAEDILSVVQSLRMIRSVPAVTMEVVTGFGEIWSAQTLHAYLQTQDVPCDWIDARDILVVKSDSGGLGEKGEASTGGVVPLWAETATRMANWWNKEGKDNGFHDIDYDKTCPPILVVTGFVATNSEGVPTTLKRSGSDYSATIFGKLLSAGRVTMWKNTDGVYTADPRRVPEAFPIASLKYDEAMELAYFGAQVLHPSAMTPCIDDNIPVYVRNIFNPSFKGTIIQGRSANLKDVADDEVTLWRSSTTGEIPIKGITSIDKAALVNLEGASLIGGTNVAERFMAAMSDASITVLMITQASSESSICVAVPENQADRALQALESAFELELARSTVNSVSMHKGMAVVAIVGEGMAMNLGVTATFMSALANANVNIRLIAQGSSERQVAVVVDGEDTSRALRAVHMAFTLSATTTGVYLVGSSGRLGQELIKQLEAQKDFLEKELNVAIKINGATTSKKMVLTSSGKGFEVSNDVIQKELDESPTEMDLRLLTDAMEADVNPHRVVIDCTSSEEVGDYYESWLGKGINVICPSKAVASGDRARYDLVCAAERKNAAQWQYESSVGAALPILTTLRDLLQTGDKVERIVGSASGTMAYCLRTHSTEVPFSTAVKNVIDLGFAEPDIREDLSGEDLRRKVVILAREIGMEINLEDVEFESLLPDSILNKEYEGDCDAVSHAVAEDMVEMDAVMDEKLKAALAEDKVLRYKFEIDAKTNTAKVMLAAVDNSDPLYRMKSNENLVAFHTGRYNTAPLIVKGSAAGADLAAAGIFADLLRLSRAFKSTQQ